MNFSTLKRFLCTVSMGLALLLGMSIQTQAQRRYSSRDGDWRARNYGQQVSARRHRRNNLRRALIRHQRSERRTHQADWRRNREVYGNSRDLRLQRRQQRAALREHQREERGAFKQRWKNNKKNR